jgi:DNA-binding CsgD family transcriptional regulator
MVNAMSIVVISDDMFYSQGLKDYLASQGVNVSVCHNIDDLEYPLQPVLLYIVAIENNSYLLRACQALNNIKNVLHVFDVMEMSNSSIYTGYISKHVECKSMWASVCRFIKTGYTRKISFSATDFIIMRSIIDDEDRIATIARRLHMSVKKVHGKKYILMKKLGFSRPHPRNLFFCNALMLLRCKENKFSSERSEQKNICFSR